MKGWVSHGIAAGIGALICLGVVLYISHGAGAKLNADLLALRTSLASATANSNQLADQLRLVHEQLDIASGRADAEQRTIADQQRLIDAGKRGIKDIADSLAGSGADIGKQIHALAEGFVRIYSIYHPGAAVGKVP